MNKRRNHNNKILRPTSESKMIMTWTPIHEYRNKCSYKILTDSNHKKWSN